MLEKIGEFDVVSGAVRVTDPCYDPDVWCSGSVPAVNGRWVAKVERYEDRMWGDRIARLVVEHVDFIGAAQYEKLGFEVGVDSGQAGVFDLSHYQDHDVALENPLKEPLLPEDPWYSMCCAVTLSKASAGVVPFGAVSTSGYGDGGYDGYAVFVDGKAVSVMIIFLLDEEEDEWDEEEDEGWDEEE